MPKHSSDDPLEIHEHEHEGADRHRDAAGDHHARAQPHERSERSNHSAEPTDNQEGTVHERPRRGHDPDGPLH